MSDTTENKNEFAELLEERRKQVEELQLKQRFAEQVATEKANEKFSEMALSWEANVLDSNSDMDAQRLKNTREKLPKSESEAVS